jgi:hypothetical protein
MGGGGPATFWLVAQCVNQIRHGAPGPALDESLLNATATFSSLNAFQLNVWLPVHN